MILRASAFALFLIALVLNDCGQETGRDELPQTEAPPPPSGAVDAPICVMGMLADQDVECPALLTDSGARLSLAGSIGDFRAGRRVCVCGTPAEMSVCQQGEALALSFIGETCPGQ